MPSAASAPIHLALTLDRGLRLELEPELLPFMEGWAPVATAPAPLVAVAPAAAPGTDAATTIVGSPAATVRVRRHHGPPPAAPSEEPHLRVGGVRCWVDDERGVALARGDAGGWAEVGLARGTADVVAPAGIDVARDAATDAVGELRALCTVALAMLTGRREGALVAAAAVIAPDGGGWLLVGDASSGKSTTATMLVTAGWSYLGDREVLLHAGDRGGTWLEGWPPASAAGGVARGRWRRTAPLAGIVSTALAPAQPTLLTRASPDEALAALVLATPWLLADAASTRHVLALLRSAARVPAWRLRLGGDTHGDAVRLGRCLRPLEAARWPAA